MTLAELQEKEPRTAAVLAQTTEAASARQVIEGLLQNRYLLDYARSQGLDRAPELEAQWQARRRELLADHEARRLARTGTGQVSPPKSCAVSSRRTRRASPPPASCT